MPDDQNSEDATQTFFRPSKRRKLALKQKVASESHEEQPDYSPANLPPQQHGDIDPTKESSLSSVLRLRKSKTRKGGIEAPQPLSNRPDTSSSSALIPAQDGESKIQDLASRRFAPQTGVKVEETDKHLMAYVDSKMAAIRSESLVVQHSEGQLAQEDDSRAANEPIKPRQPAGAGKLMEIDLGPAATQRNIDRTEAATRRLAGDGSTVEAEGSENKKRQRTRLGPDGKPWRSRRKNQKTEEDIKRDAIVEQVLRETRLDMYEAQAGIEPQDGGEDGEDADERMAAQFKQEFYDSQLAKRKTTAAPPSRPGEERPKGPKLGGSRNARAAMQKALEEASKKKS